MDTKQNFLYYFPMDATLKFTLTHDADPDEVLSRLEEADTAQAFNLSTSNGTLSVSSQIEHTSDEIRAFVEQTVGELIERSL